VSFFDQSKNSITKMKKADGTGSLYFAIQSDNYEIMKKMIKKPCVSWDLLENTLSLQPEKKLN